jgi:nondiscriminating aspartyl-tRNA synthetase
VEILSRAEALPFDTGSDKLNLELPTLLDYRTLTLRHASVKPIFDVQAAVLEGFRRISVELGFVEIVVPTIAASSTEGGAEVFKVNYYDHKAFMTQSPQLYKQMMVPVFERVFTIAHAYRAEPSVTTRHLSETTQMDIEAGFVTFEELLDMLETVGVETLKYAEKQNKKTFEQFGIEPIAFGKIPRLTLREAQEVIYKEFGRDNRKEKDLTPQDEVDLCAWAKEKHHSDLVTITHFPTAKRAFYTMPDPKDPEYSLSYDLLFRGVEVLSGSQRISDYDQLVQVIKDRGMDPANFTMYLQAFKYGMPPEGGFSFGLERITMKLLELQNIREASLFPRDMERVDERFSTIKETKKILQKKEGN